MRTYRGEKGREIQFTFSKRKTTQLNNKHKPCTRSRDYAVILLKNKNTATTWLNISVLSFHNFGKESKGRAPYLNFRILSQIDLREEKEIHL